MRALAGAYPDDAIVQQLVAQIPWGHNVRILDAIDDPKEREWYIRKIIEHGWSRPILEHQLDTRLYHRQGKAVTNFHRALPSPQSALAQQVLKDPYNFDFLTLSEEAVERDFERELLRHIREFLLELGAGFAFVGNQYHVKAGGQDFYIDLLFYHLRLRAYVVIEIKWTDFKPEYAGKMNFYLSAADDLLRQKGDKPLIGIILCKTENKVVAEYALRDTHKPIGVSVCRMTEALPHELKGKLPTVHELEAELKRNAVPEGPGLKKPSVEE
jgi:predicted nuclease of restriction endonuclease-like (RecB) superfamily